MSYFSLETQKEFADLQRSKFNLSYDNMFGDNMGKIIPFMVKEVVPGDSFTVQSAASIKLAPMVAPAFAYIDVNMRYFYVPYRLVYEDWDKFIMGDETKVAPAFAFEDPDDGNVAQFLQGSLYDYLGGSVQTVSPGVPSATLPHINLLPFRAYQLIYQEYYRPREIDYVDIDKAGGLTTYVATIPDEFNIRYSSNYGDYFSSAKLSETDTNIAVPATLEELNKAQGFYRFFQRLRYTGKRYADYMKVFFGQNVDSDSLHVPEYLGGKSDTVQIQDVIQTTPTEGVPLGSYAGKGYANTKSFINKEYFKEHGIILGLMDITPRIFYNNFHDRLLLNKDYTSFFQPHLETAYMDTIMLGEAFTSNFAGGAGFSQTAYAYVEPYHNLKYSYNQVHGVFKSQYDYWSAIRGLNNSLDDALVYSPTVNRWEELIDGLFADSNEPHFYAQVFNAIEAIRPLKRNLFK